MTRGGPPSLAELTELVLAGPEPPVRGTYRGRDGLEQDVTVRVWLSGSRHRVEDLQGRPLSINDGTVCWHVEWDGTEPLAVRDTTTWSGQAPQGLERPDRRRLARGLALRGPVVATTHLGRACWAAVMVFGKTHGLDVLVEAATGRILRASVHGGDRLAGEWLELEGPLDLDDSLFSWDGPATTTDEIADSVFTAGLKWFRDHVGEPDTTLVVPVDLRLTVRAVESFDRGTGAFAAVVVHDNQVGAGSPVGRLERRPVSEPPLPAPDGGHAWSTPRWHWSVVLNTPLAPSGWRAVQDSFPAD